MRTHLTRRLIAPLHDLALVACAVAFAGPALAQPQQQLVAPPRPAPAPAVVAPAWRPPTLSVAGASQPVRMSTLKIDVDIAAGVAMTRVQMEFVNPNNRILEGKLQFPLAPGQIVAGFALDVDGRLRDAVPIEKARGQQVFEDIARRGVDPGLLQTTAGNNYELRLYPLAPGKPRTVVLTIVEPAAGRLQVPLAYASRLERFELAIRSAATTAPRLAGSAPAGLRFEHDSSGGQMARLAGDDVAPPTQPLALDLPHGDGSAAEIATAEHAGSTYFTLALPIVQRPQWRPLPRRVQIVWDASGSGAARQIDRELALLDAYFKRAQNIEVSLVKVADAASAGEHFDVRGGDWAALKKALLAVTYDGASNLGAVRHDGVAGEAILFSDGLANYGTAWKLAFPVPVYAVNSAASSDPAALQALADASGGAAIDLGAMSRQAAADALLKRGTRVERIDALGAADIVSQSGSAAAGRLVVAGRLTDASAELGIVLRDPSGATSTRTVRIAAKQAPGHLAALQWARLMLASLEGDARTNKARIRALGQRFALATRETSLIVLEQAADYARYEVEPPAELRAAVEQITRTARRQKAQTDAARLADVVRRWDARVAWWSKEFPKDAQPRPLVIGKGERGAGDAIVAGALNQRVEPRAGNAAAGRDADRMQRQDESVSHERAASPTGAPAAPPPMAVAAAAPVAVAKAARAGSMQTFAAAEVGRSEAKQKDGATAAAASIAIALTPASRGSAALKRLQAAPPDERLAVYRDERTGNAGNVGFFLDAGDFFLSHGEHATGLRVLSNLAELDLQNRDVLRLLGYRLQQAGEAALAVPIFERVLELAPHEPQSERDLGLALAAAGRPQQAIDHLYEVVTGQWDARFPDIELIALEELNAIAAQPRRGEPDLELGRVDKRLRKVLPLDLRVVLAWDADNTDVDLHVIDPNGEEVYYGHALSYQGGAITRDATGGYGPEEFALRVAKPGTYRVEAQFYGHRQQVLTNSTGLMLWLSSGYATSAQQDQRTTVRVASERGERVVIGEFEVKR